MPRPDEVQYQKLTWLLKRLQVAEDYCRPYFDRAKRHYRLYRFGSAVDNSDWPYVNRVKTRDILAFVEDTTATMVQTLLGTIPWYSVIPRYTSQLMQMYTGIDAVKLGRQIERVLDNQISHEDVEFLDEMVDCFKEGGIFGNSYTGVYPKFDVNGNYQRPLIKTTGFWDVLPIPGARRMSKSLGVFVREFLAREEVEKLAAQGVFGNVEDLSAIFGSKSGYSNDTESAWHKQLLNEVGITNYEPDNDDLEVIHYFSGGHVMTMVNRAVIVRDSNEENPETGNVVKPFPYDLPLVQYKYMPVPLEFFGMGIPEVLEVLQEDKNLIRSARRDNIDVCIQKILKAKAGSDINYDLIKYYSGAIWPLENLEDIEPIEIGDVTASSYREEEKIQFDMENALSMFGYARGMTPTHEERPTTVIKLQQAAMNRTDLAIKLAEFTVLQNIATRVILLVRRYMPQQEYEMIVGEPDAGFYMMSEDELRKFYLIKPMGSSVTHIKEIRQQQIQFAADVLEKIAMVGPTNIKPFTIDWYEAGKAALDVADIKNIDQILIPLQPQQMMGMGMPGMPGMPQQGMMPNPQQAEQLQQVNYGGEQQ
jgi:hypothetical protein